MTEVREVTGTAFIVAEYRARENEETHPLYVDRIVPIFLDARTRAAADAIVMKVLADLRERVRQFAISFDYMDEAVVARTTGERGTTAFVERFAAMGAPWHFGIDDLDALADEAAMTIADAVTVGHLHRAYWPDRPLESIIYDHYSLCTLKPCAA